MTASKKQRRVERRALERVAAKAVRERERLAHAEAGGSPENPLEISTASLVELQARSIPCPLCGSTMRIDEHTADTIEGERLRIAHMVCVACGIPRKIYFRIVVPAPN